MTVLQFYCSALYTLITANKGTLDAFDALPGDEDAQATISLSLDSLKDVFQYKPSPTNNDKPKFRLVTTPSGLLGIDLDNCVVATNKAGGNTLADQRIGYDWTRYLATVLFNNFRGAEFFSNEGEATNLHEAFADQFEAKLDTQVAISNGTETVSKSIFDQIAAADPARFGTAEAPITPTPATNAPSGGDTIGWYQIPLKATDEICFKFEVAADADQTSIITDMAKRPASIDNRVYLIRIQVA